MGGKYITHNAPDSVPYQDRARSNPESSTSNRSQGRQSLSDSDKELANGLLEELQHHRHPSQRDPEKNEDHLTTGDQRRIWWGPGKGSPAYHAIMSRVRQEVWRVPPEERWRAGEPPQSLPAVWNGWSATEENATTQDDAPDTRQAGDQYFNAPLKEVHVDPDVVSDLETVRSETFEPLSREGFPLPSTSPEASFEFVEVNQEIPPIKTPSSDTWQGWYWASESSPPVCVALKQLRHTSELDSGQLHKRFTRELEIWRTLDHPNVLRFFGTFCFGNSEAGEIFFVSPWMENGNVMEFIARSRSVNREMLLLGIAKGMHYLHGRIPSIAHGDLKGKNVLVDGHGVPLLCDFGLSVYQDLSRATTTLALKGTRNWMAPERLYPEAFGLRMSETRTTQADVFSFAMTAYEILTERIPFHDKSEMEIMMGIVAGKRPTLPDQWNQGLAILLTDCWKQERQERPTADEVVSRLDVLLDLLD